MRPLLPAIDDGSAVLAAVLAHQGGWDEILLVLAPIVILAGLLVVANRRAAAKLADQPAGDGDETREQPAE